MINELLLRIGDIAKSDKTDFDKLLNIRDLIEEFIKEEKRQSYQRELMSVCDGLENVGDFYRRFGSFPDEFIPFIKEQGCIVDENDFGIVTHTIERIRPKNKTK